jgi:hypothetical protein
MHCPAMHVGPLLCPGSQQHPKVQLPLQNPPEAKHSKYGMHLRPPHTASGDSGVGAGVGAVELDGGVGPGAVAMQIWMDG